MNPWIKIIRPINGLMSIIATSVSGFIGLGTAIIYFFNWKYIMFAVIVAFLITCAGNVLNDVVDVEIDKVNHPTRPIPAGQINKNRARSVSMAFFGVGIIVSILTLHLISIIIAVIASILLAMYELRIKKFGLSKNLTISLLVGLLFIFGGVSVNAGSKMIILFVLAFLAIFSREIIKDVEDISGDVNRKTLPKRYGIKVADYLAFLVVVVLVAISFLPYYLGILSVFYLYVVILADFIFLVSVFITFRSPTKGQQISKYAMIIALASFVIGELV